MDNIIDHHPPLISVLMPAFNVQEYVQEAIQSILNQTYTNWELIIIDDCSTDKTRDVLATYTDPRIRVLHNPQNLGYITTYNKLLTLVKGEYSTFLDADDYCAPNRLELQYQAFVQNPQLGMVGTAYHLVSATGEIIETIQKPTSYTEIQQVIQQYSPFCGATLMVSKQVLEQVGGYRDFFKKGYAYQDYDRAYRIVEQFESINLAEPLYFYRQNPISNSKKISIKRFVSDKIVQYLGKQRQTQGADDLQRNDEAALEQYVQKLIQPYEQDPSLIYRKYAESFMFQQLYRKAIGASWDAIKQAPTKFINYRTWFYCVRKTLAKKLFK